MPGKAVKGTVEFGGKSSRLLAEKPIVVSWTTPLMSDNVAFNQLALSVEVD